MTTKLDLPITPYTTNKLIKKSNGTERNCNVFSFTVVLSQGRAGDAGVCSDIAMFLVSPSA